MMGGIRGTYCDKCICHIANCSCDRRAPAEPAPASTGRVPDAWMVGIDVFKTRAQAERNVRDPDLAPIPLYRPVAARELDVEAERREFEALIVPEWSRETEIDSDGDTVYVEDWMQGAFIGYQLGRAARSAAQSTAPAPSKMLDAQLRYIFELEQKVVALEAQVAAQPEVAQVSTEQAGDAVIEAARKLIKAKGRYHTEQSYKALMAEVQAYNALGDAVQKMDSPNNSPVGADKEP